MKPLSLAGLLLAAMLFAAVPITAKDTPSGWQIKTDTAQAYVTYRRARVATRRAYRHGYHAVPSYYGHADGASGYPYSAGYYAYRGVYGAPVARRVTRRAVVRRHW